MVFHISTPWVLLRPWFSFYSPCEYYSDHGFPKSTVIVAIQPMASIWQERVYVQLFEFKVLHKDVSRILFCYENEMQAGTDRDYFKVNITVFLAWPLGP